MGGFEPPHAEPESVVLPLDDTPIKMAGQRGFEPPDAWTKTMCLTAWRLPIITGGEGGIRTLGEVLSPTYA